MSDQEKEPRRERFSDAWFRFVTRLRAIGYWLREKGTIAWRWTKRAGGDLSAWWSRRSSGAKMRIFAVAGVLVLYLIVKFLPVPGVPCEVSAAKECAPSNDTIAYVPRNADLYAHLTVNSDSHQWELARDLRDELPNFTALLQSDTSALAIPSARPVDLTREVLPWAKDDLALLGVPGPQRTTPEAYIVGVGDDGEGEPVPGEPLSRAAGRRRRRSGTARSRSMADGLATAVAGGEALFGNVLGGPGRPRRQGGARAGAGGLRPRTRPDPQLPDVRLAEVYLSQAGVQRLLAGRAGTASQLDTFVDYGATTGLAASARAEDDGVEVNMVSELEPGPRAKEPDGLRQPAAVRAGPRGRGRPERARATSGSAISGRRSARLSQTAGAGAQGLAGSLRALGQSLQQQAGVEPLPGPAAGAGRAGGSGRRSRPAASPTRA